jgi:hypothetical protein
MLREEADLVLRFRRFRQQRSGKSQSGEVADEGAAGVHGGSINVPYSTFFNRHSTFRPCILSKART